MFASIVCFGAVTLKNKLGWDDALDVWGVHGVGGILGSIAVGVFASTHVNPAAADGLLLGNGIFFMKQTLTVFGASLYSFVTTFILLRIVDTITSVKVTKEEEEKGLDEIFHGEHAYDYIPALSGFNIVASETEQSEKHRSKALRHLN